MVKEIEEQVQAIIIVDISVADKIMAVETIQRAHVINEIVYSFKPGSGIHGYQTLFGLNVSDLAVNGQSKIAGNRADDQQIIRLHAFKYG